jgi:hypothetical protein
MTNYRCPSGTPLLQLAEVVQPMPAGLRLSRLVCRKWNQHGCHYGWPPPGCYSKAVHNCNLNVAGTLVHPPTVVMRRTRHAALGTCPTRITYLATSSLYADPPHQFALPKRTALRITCPLLLPCRSTLVPCKVMSTSPATNLPCCRLPFFICKDHAIRLLYTAAHMAGQAKTPA